MSYREPDEMAQLRARVEAVERKLEDARAERRRHVREVWRAVAPKLRVGLAILGTIGLSGTLLGQCSASQRSRCERMCAVNGKRFEWTSTAPAHNCNPFQPCCTCSGEDGLSTYSYTGKPVRP